MKDKLNNLIKSKTFWSVCAAIAVCAAVAVALLGRRTAVASVTQGNDTLFAMDTYMSFTVYAENPEKALSEAKQLVQDCEKRWSVTDEQSEIYALNKSGQLKPANETLNLLSLAKGLSDFTNECFNPTIYPLVKAWGFTTDEHRVPQQSEIDELLKTVNIADLSIVDGEARLLNGASIDLGGIAKGHVGDLVIDSFKSNGATSALINLGGNVQTLGTKPDGSDWRVGIQSPFDDGIIGVISISDKCVITSGAYERYFIAEDGTRYGHIISPFDGYPVNNGVVSVSVICESGAMGDALSTALFVMGADDAIEFWKTHDGFDVIILTDDGTLYVSQGIFSSFSERESQWVSRVQEIKR